MNVHIDPISLLATCRINGTVQQLKQRLSAEGYMADLPAKETMSLSKALPLLDIISVELDSKQGLLRTKRVAHSSTGPNFTKIFIQSGTQFGRIIEITLRIRPKPERVETIPYRFSDPQPFLRALQASGVQPKSIEIKKTNRHAVRINLKLAGRFDLVGAELAAIIRLADAHGGIHIE